MTPREKFAFYLTVLGFWFTILSLHFPNSPKTIIGAAIGSLLIVVATMLIILEK